MNPRFQTGLLILLWPQLNCLPFFLYHSSSALQTQAFLKYVACPEALHNVQIRMVTQAVGPHLKWVLVRSHI